MSENHQEKKCKYNNIGLYLSLFIVIIMVVLSLVFFCIINNETYCAHNLKFDEELMAQIDSLETTKVQNLIELKEEGHQLKEEGHQVKEEGHQVKEEGHQLKEEVHQLKEEVHQLKEEGHQLKEEGHQLKKLTKYFIDRESKYQMEIDLVIDKYSQWSGFWLCIISCILTIFTIIQAFINYRTNDESTKKSKDAINNCKISIEKIKKEFSNDMKETKKDLQLSAYQNKLSCITTCLSSFPDTFSLSPNDERQIFIRNFIRILCEEYKRFTGYITELAMLDKQEEKFITYQEVNHIYLIWCDISMAINRVMLDFTKTEQIIAFRRLRDELNTTIFDIHNQKINYTNVAERMREIMVAIDNLANVISS